MGFPQAPAGQYYMPMPAQPRGFFNPQTAAMRPQNRWTQPRGGAPQMMGIQVSQQMSKEYPDSDQFSYKFCKIFL